MKFLLKGLALITLTASAAFGSPLAKSEIPGDAKWLLHLDVDQFRDSKIGKYIIAQIINKQLEHPVENLHRDFKIDLRPEDLMQKIQSITLYGTDYQNPKLSAVAIVKTAPDLQSILVGGLAGMALAGTNAPFQVTQSQRGDVTMYSINNAVYCGILSGKLAILSASKSAIEKAADVLSGSAPSLKSSGVFSEYSDMTRTILFFAAAEGFNANNNLPPQAKLLQMADGGCLAVGERAEQMSLKLALKAKTAEIVSQMQQVVQGLIAMASISKPDDKDLAQLVQSTKVSASDRVVSVSLEYPVEKVIRRIDEQREKRAERRAARLNAAPPPNNNNN